MALLFAIDFMTSRKFVKCHDFRFKNSTCHFKNILLRLWRGLTLDKSLTNASLNEREMWYTIFTTKTYEFYRDNIEHFLLYSIIKDLYSRKDTNLVFSRFISRGEVLCYNRAKINSLFWNALRIRMKINQLHQSLCYTGTSSIYYTTQNNSWICRYRFNGKVFWFFSVSPYT